MAGKPDEHAKTLPKGMASCATLPQMPEFLVALADWHYRALRRANRPNEAKDLLKAIRDDLPIQDSISNYRALQFYKGKMKEKEVLEGLEGVRYANASTAVALVHMLEGRAAAGCGLWKKASETKPWSAFGVITAEVELTRTSRAACSLFVK
jgi:hypothetical protein